MTFVSTKTINGKSRNYLEKSIRLPNGKTKKYSLYLKDYNTKTNLQEYEYLLEENINKDLVGLSLKQYKKDYIFSEDIIKKLEEIKIGYKKILNKLSDKQFQDIIDRFTANFTYESNAIEGNSLTLKDVMIVLYEGKMIKGKDLREVYETLNMREAMSLVFNNKLGINEKEILKLHEVVVKNTGVSFGYKKIPNFIQGKDIETVPPENVKKEVDALIKWYNENKSLHPLQKAAIFHGKFEEIHAFDDGNGRVGRLLINVILLNEGYPPLIIRKTQRVSYLSALESFDKHHNDKLFRFLIEKYKETYKKFFLVYIKYLK